jgi:hypothetical protein
VGSDMRSDLVGWGRFELPTSSSRTGLQPCYQVFCGLKATGWCGVEPISGLPWRKNGGSPRGDSHAIRNILTVNRERRRHRGSPAAPETAGPVHRGRRAQDRGSRRRSAASSLVPSRPS